MGNKEKYDKIFKDSFSLDQSQLNDALVYNQVPAWDSIGHMTLVASCEEVFNIVMETDDIINFSSYLKGFELMAKYGVSF